MRWTRQQVAIVLATLVATGLAAAQPPQAAVYYSSGTAALAAGRFEDAGRDCEAAVRLLQGGSPAVLGRTETCVARAAIGARRFATAVRFAAQAISHIEASGARERRYRDDLEFSRTVLRDFGARVSYVAIEFGPTEAHAGARATFDGSMLVEGQALTTPVPLDAGDHVVEVASPGFVGESRRFSLTEGERLTVPFGTLATETIAPEVGINPPSATWKRPAIAISVGAGTDGCLGACSYYETSLGLALSAEVAYQAMPSLSLGLTAGSMSVGPDSAAFNDGRRTMFSEPDSLSHALYYVAALAHISVAASVVEPWVAARVGYGWIDFDQTSSGGGGDYMLEGSGSGMIVAAEVGLRYWLDVGLFVGVSSALTAAVFWPDPDLLYQPATGPDEPSQFEASPVVLNLSIVAGYGFDP